MTLQPFAKSSPFSGTLIGVSSNTSLFSTGASEFMLRPQLLIQAQTTYTGITTKPLEKTKKPSTQEIISAFRKDGIPLSAIADMAKVERKTIYSWLNRSAIRLENQERLEALYDLFFSNKEASLLYLYRYWNQTTQGGCSLHSLLTAKKLNSAAIKKALLELWPLAKKYQADLAKSYQLANEDEGQRKSISEWQETLLDGSDEW